MDVGWRTGLRGEAQNLDFGTGAHGQVSHGVDLQRDLFGEIVLLDFSGSDDMQDPPGDGPRQKGARIRPTVRILMYKT